MTPRLRTADLEPREDLEVGLWCKELSFYLCFQCASKGLFLLSSTLGLEQLRNLRHLDVAYNLLERHTELSPLWLLTELRKVRMSSLWAWEPPSGLGLLVHSNEEDLISGLPSLSALQLYLEGNPLSFHPAHRATTAQYLSLRARDAAHGVSDYLVSVTPLLSLRERLKT